MSTGGVTDTPSIAREIHQLLAQDFASWLSGQASKHTVRHYVAAVRDFVTAVGHPVYATREAVGRWFDTACSDVAPGTSNKKLAAVRSFYRFLAIRDLRSDDPTNLLRQRRRDKRLVRPIPGHDIGTLFAYVRAHQETLEEKQDLAIIETLYGSGLRRDECARLRLSNITSRELLTVFGKGRKERRAVMTDRQFQALLAWIAAYHKIEQVDKEEWFWRFRRDHLDLPVFYTKSGKPFESLADPGHQIWLRVRAYAKFFGIAIRPHRFRHTLGTNLVEQGVPLQDVADMFGHESLNTTRNYVDRGLRGLELIRKKHPEQQP